MKKRLFFLAVFGIAVLVWAQGLDPAEILEKVRAAWQPGSLHARVVLEVQRGEEIQRWALEVWSEGEDKALVRVLSPQEEAGSGYLVLGDEIWYYSPQAGIPVQLPALALSEGAFGGAAVLEDVFRGTLAEECEVSAEPTESGWLLVLLPKPDAPVVWGRLELTVREDFALLGMRFFDQRGDLLRTVQASEFIEAEGKPFPTTLKIEDASGEMTIERLNKPEIGVDIPDEVFTLESLEVR